MSNNHRRNEHAVPIARCIIGISIILFVTGSCLFYLWNWNEIDKTGREIKALERRLAELRSQNEVVQGRIARLASTATLQQRYATGFFKLDPITQFEPVYRIATSDGNEVRPVSNPNRSPRP